MASTFEEGYASGNLDSVNLYVTALAESLNYAATNNMDGMIILFITSECS